MGKKEKPKKNWQEMTGREVMERIFPHEVVEKINQIINVDRPIFPKPKSSRKRDNSIPKE